MTKWDLNLEEEFYRESFESSFNSIVILNLEGRIINCNHSIEQIFGYKKSEIIGKDFREIGFFQKRHISGISNSFKSLLKGNIPKPQELQVIGKDGPLIWIYLQANLIKIKDETYIQAIAQDISKLKDIEYKLKKSEKKYKKIIEHLDMGFFHADINGIILNHNPMFNQILGLNPNESLAGLSDLKYWENLDDRERFVNSLDKKGYVKNQIVPFKKKSGERSFLQMNSHLFMNKDSNALEIEGTILDITEKSILERKLKESEEKYRELIELLPETIFEINSQGMITYVNRAGLQQFKFTQEEIYKGLSIRKLFTSSEEIERAQKIMTKILEGKDTGPNEYLMKKVDGTLFYSRAYSRPIYKEGKIVGLRGVLHDITESKKTEEKLKDSQNKLEILNQTFLKFGKDPIVNIQHLVDAVGQLLGADCALYNKLIDFKETKVLKTLAIYNEPPNYKFEDNPIGHICYDVIQSNTDDIVIFDNLNSSKYVNTDINVKNYGLKQYFGCGVKLNEKIVATFCVVYIKNREFSDMDKNILKILAKSASIEEHRMQAIMDLKESEKKYKNIIENTNDAIVIMGFDGKFKYISPQLSKILGGMDLTLETSVFRDTHPDEVDYLVDTFSKAIKKKEVISDDVIEFRTLHSEGHYIWLASSSKNYYDDEGNIIGFLISLRDVSDRKIAEQKLKDSEKKYRHLFNSTPYAIWLVNLKGIIIDCNSTINEFMSFFKREDLIGKSFQEVIRMFLSFGDKKFKDLINIFRERFKLLIKNGKLDPFEFNISRGDGKNFWITLETSLVTVANETLIQVFIKNVTGRKEAEIKIQESEESLRILNKELEQKVKERTKELEEKNQELLVIDQLKNDFISMAAHELKTPLISVSGYTDFILTKHKDTLDFEVKEDLHIVQRNIQRLQKLMNQLLDVMKIDSKNIKLNKEPTNVSSIIFNCIHELSYLFKEKNQKMILNVSNEIILNVDNDRMFQIFSNLISNANKFTPDDGTIEISAEPFEENSYLFKVKDNGVGLEPTKLNKIFDKFWGIDNINTASYTKGTGLGLYISKGFVESHGGKIWASSEGKNRGFSINFTIPNK